MHFNLSHYFIGLFTVTFEPNIVKSNESKCDNPFIVNLEDKFSPLMLYITCSIPVKKLLDKIGYLFDLANKL